MPNHVVNRIIGSPALIERLMSASDKGEPEVDFNRIVPCPKEIVCDSISLHIKSAAEIALGLIDFRPPSVDPRATGDLSGVTKMLHRDICARQMLEGPMPKDFSDTDFELFIRLLRAYRACGGIMDWYDWNIKNWGTKWNAYDFERISESEIKFETAWSAPHPVIERLDTLAGEKFRHEWADEDTGNNVGYREYAGEGGFYNERELSGTREGYELAFKLRPGLGDEYRLVGDSYEYFDAEEAMQST